MKKMCKRFTSTVVAMVLVFNTFMSVATAEFQDLKPDYWGYSKINEFAEKGYLSGYEDNTFKPDNAITKAEFVQLVNNYFGFSGNEEKVADFSDINQAEWYSKAINEAVSRGYISGYADKTFKPNEFITRQEAISILAKILNIADEEIADKNEEYLKKYSDYAEVADWAKKSMYNYLTHGFVKGYSDGTLRPNNFVTRAELIHLLNTIEEKIIIENPENKSNVTNNKTSSSSRRKYYTITVNVGENGSATPSITRVRKGNDVDIVITPNYGYEPSVKDNNVDVTEKVQNDKYTIRNVVANHIVDIAFEPAPTASPTTTPTPTPTTPPPTASPTTTPTPTSTTPPPTAEPTPTPTSPSKPECKCGEALKELVDVIKEITNKRVEALMKELESAKGNAQKVKEIVEKWLKSEIDDSEYKDEIYEIIEKIEKAEDLDKILPEIKKELEKILYSDTIQDIVSKIMENVNTDKIKEVVNELKENAELTVDKWKEIIEKIFEKHDCEKVQKLIYGIIDLLKDMDNTRSEVEEKIDKIVEDLSEELGVSKEELKELAEKLIDDGKATLEELKDKIKEEIKKLPSQDELEEQIKKIIEDIKDKIHGKLPSDSEVKELMKILKDLKDNPEKMKEYIENYFAVTTIKYNANKPSDANFEVKGSTDNSEHKNNHPSKLSENGFSLEGYRFIGWSKEEDSTENEFDLEKEYKSSDFDYKENVLLYAVWEKVENETFHKITLDDKLKGRIKVSESEDIAAGEIITVTIEDEYELAKGTLKYSYNGEEYEIKEKDRRYTFIMPSSDVSIEAEFIYRVNIKAKNGKAVVLSEIGDIEDRIKDWLKNGIKDGMAGDKKYIVGTGNFKGLLNQCKLKEIKITPEVDVDENRISSELLCIYEFTMPEDNVEIEVIFE